MKNEFESQINKLCTFANNSGCFAIKLYPERTHDGKYLEGEPYDYQLFLPGYKATFDAKETHGDRWDFKPKDIKQADNLKRCKNVGFDAFFLVYFYKSKRMIKFDIDVFCKALGEGRKSLKEADGTKWKEIEEVLRKMKR